MNHRPTHLQTLVTSALIAVGAAGTALLLAQVPILAALEDRTIDGRIRLRAARPPHPSIVIVHIDEPVMQAQPFRSPVPRGMLADLVASVARCGPAAILLDVFLKDMTLPADDARLEATLRAASNVVLVAARRTSGDGHRLDTPHPRFAAAAHAIGLADIPIDPVDQRVRRYRAFHAADGQLHPAAATVLAMPAQPSPVIPADFAARFPSLPAGQAFRIDYRGPACAVADPPPFPAFPASAILALGDSLPSDWFSNRTVIIGAAFDESRDDYRTPYYAASHGYRLTPGCELHAHALATILDGNPPRPAGTAMVLLVMALILGVQARVDAQGRARRVLLAGVLLLGTYTAVAVVVFERAAILLPITPVLLSITLQFVATTTYRAATEGRQKRWIKSAFQRYLSPDYVDQLVRRPELLEQGGMERELTILFTDLAGFTTISEKLGVRDLVTLLNRYFDGMTRILLEEGGTLDKYIGDSIMAFWGAPLPQPDHRERCLRAALRMSRFSDALSAEFVRAGHPPFRTRLGISTGTVIVGNMGSRERVNYTLIGDEVNLASRLEGANKAYGSTILVAESALLPVREGFLARELDWLRVKGRAAPVRVFELTGLAAEPDTGSARKVAAAFEAALASYRAGAWDAAETAFRRVLALRPDDAPTRAFLERITRLRSSPPTDWDGVFTMTSK